MLISSALMLLLVGCSVSQHTGNKDHHAQVLDEYLFMPTDNIEQKIDSTLAQAAAKNKLAMIVLGAQWCHDSRGLAANFSSPEMQPILQQNFEIIFVDVGYLEDRRDITRRFNYPAYFATPTVMIVDPVTHTLINQSSLHIWQSADSVDMETYQDYFSQIGQQQGASVDKGHPAYVKLARFTQVQVDRLHEGYARLGPLLQADVENRLDDTTELNRLWGEVRTFRITLQRDIHALREQLKTQPETPLTLPSYPAHSWE